MTGAEWVTAELADVRYWQAMQRYAAAMLADTDDLATAAAALCEVFQLAEQLSDELTVWSAIRAAMPSSAWNPN